MRSTIGLLLLQIFALVAVVHGGCRRSVTTSSGKYAKRGPYCSGEVIFEENFNSLNEDLWVPEVTLAGGNNGEFEWYVNNRSNSFTNDGRLHIKPTLTADVYGEHFLLYGHAHPEHCTDSSDQGCNKQANGRQILNPIQSAKLTTNNKFHFKYGTMEVVARVPVGNWLWPAIWLLPQGWKYGSWPVSGEIDLMESRGNPEWVTSVGSTLHFGPLGQDGYEHAHYSQYDSKGFDNGFHKFKFEWTESYIRFFVDGKEIGTTKPGNGGFWQLGEFRGQDPWRHGSHMAPFDQEFYIILNLAVGGTNGFFPNVPGKPWQNGSPTAALEFWNGRHEWLPGWRLNEKDGWYPSLIIDSVTVWAL